MSEIHQNDVVATIDLSGLTRLQVVLEGSQQGRPNGISLNLQQHRQGDGWTRRFNTFIAARNLTKLVDAIADAEDECVRRGWIAERPI